MTAATPPRLLSISLLLNIVIHFLPQFPVLLVTASRDVSSKLPVTSSYQPSSSVEGKWIAEEEFHGASSLSTTSGAASESQQQRRLKSKDKQKYAPIHGHERLEDHPSWWDDEEGSGFDVVDEDDDEQRMTTTTTPQTSASNKDNATLPRRKGLRMRIWKRSNRQMRNEESPSISSSLGKNHPAEESNSPPSSSSTSSEYDEEHPMRTDEWLLNIRLSRLYPIEEGEYFPECNNLARYSSVANTSLAPKKGGGGSRTKRQVMQFARNGYVKIIEDDEKMGIKRKCKPRVGKWRIGHSGVAFDIPMQMQVMHNGAVGRTQHQHQLLPSAQVNGSDNRIEDAPQSRVTTTTTTVLHYHADIHLNKFGERPRMFRGVITRDR
jgi:hypothetical protein